MIIKKIFKMMAVLLVVIISPLVHARFFEDSAQGWHWYNEPEFLLEKPEPDKTLATQTLAPVPQTPTEMVEAYRKELDTRLHTAWVNPSPRNIQAYQELQKDMMDRAEQFSKVWMQVVYNNPHLDHTLITPVNHKARHLYLDQQKKEVTSTIKSLSEEYGLFFFFSSQCDYCHQFAPIVKRFSEDYGLKVMAISVDGGSLEGFSNVVKDNGILQQWKVEVLPALFAVNPKTAHVIPIAYGVASIDEMETRIMALTQNGEPS